MGIVSTLKSLASGLFRRGETLALDGERAQRGSFLTDLRSYMQYGEVYPGYQFEFIDVLSWLAIFHHDVSQVVKKIVALGNVGHGLELTGSEAAAAAALKELNALARNAFPNNAGADGFINQQFRQIIVKGALCQETAPSMGLNEVGEVYQVKTSSIRFRFEEGRYVPYQHAGARQIKLNEETFSYIPLFTEEDSPYAIPPFLSALRMIMRQDKQWNGIDEFTLLWGILGFTHMIVDIKPKLGEVENEFRERARKELERYYEMYRKNMKTGLAITGPNVTLEHKAVSKNAGQMKDIMEATQQGVTSGLNIDPALLGYSYSTTETYATVCYETLLGEIANIRRIIKRVNEHTYNLHLTLRRIPATCTMTFNPAPSLQKYEDAQTREIDQRMVLERMDKEIISPDDAARELGYDEAYRNGDGNGAESSFSRIEFEYNRGTGRYEFSRPVISIAREALAKKKSPMTRG